jgi:hypothetical protein
MPAAGGDNVQGVDFPAVILAQQDDLRAISAFAPSNSHVRLEKTAAMNGV